MTFQQQINKRKLTTQAQWRKAIHGKKIRVVGNSSGHNWGITGTVFIADAATSNNISFNGSTVTGLKAYHQPGNTWISFNDFEVLDNSFESIKEQLECNKEELKRLKAECELLQKKAAYLEYHGLEELDERQYLAYEIVQVMKSNSDDKIKAKHIAELLP